MVRDEPPEDLIKPYWDPALKSSRKNYRCLMQRLHKIGYLRYTFKPLARAGMFFVHKSDRKKIRLIVDARPANQLFHSPPSVQLCTSEGFCPNWDRSPISYPARYWWVSAPSSRSRLAFWISRCEGLFSQNASAGLALSIFLLGPYSSKMDRRLGWYKSRWTSCYVSVWGVSDAGFTLHGF